MSTSTLDSGASGFPRTHPQGSVTFIYTLRQKSPDRPVHHVHIAIYRSIVQVLNNVQCLQSQRPPVLGLLCLCLISARPWFAPKVSPLSHHKQVDSVLQRRHRLHVRGHAPTGEPLGQLMRERAQVDFLGSLHLSYGFVVFL